MTDLISSFDRLSIKASANAAKPRETILDLGQYLEKGIIVKFNGGRQVHGILKGFDALLNLVLDETVEQIRDPEDPYTLLDDTRNLGLVVLRGSAIMLIMPIEGTEEIVNPFNTDAQQQEI